VATIGVIAALIGLGLLLRPVETPVQDCGAPIAFLLDGRTNVGADPTAPPPGLTAADVRSNNERPCRVRVAEAAKPAGTLIAAGLVAAVGAALVESFARGFWWMRNRRVATT